MLSQTCSPSQEIHAPGRSYVSLGWGVLKGSLGGGMPLRPSNPDKIRSFQYPVYDKDKIPLYFLGDMNCKIAEKAPSSKQTNLDFVTS